MAERIFVSNLCLHGRHGVLAEESALGQKFFVDIDCSVDIDDALRDDDYSKTLCYSGLCDLAAEVSSSGRFNLIETLADRIANVVLMRFAAVAEVRVRIRKPFAPIAAMLDHVGAEVSRRRATPIGLSLGSNVGNKLDNIAKAISRLADCSDIDIDEVSHFYRTAPWGKTDQDWFVNACITGTTSANPRDLLRRCKAVEIQVGRLKNVRWGPRIVDIDLLYFGDTAMNDVELTLPHPEIFNRAFVLQPLAEIAPDQVVAGRNVGQAAAEQKLGQGEVERIDDPYAMLE